MLDLLKNSAPFGCTVSSTHQKLTEYFKEKGIEAPSLDARLLICASCSIRYERFIAYPDMVISLDQRKLLHDYVQRRVSGEPISRIFGKREFWSHSFTLNRDTLDPRPDTETLVTFVLELLAKNSQIKENIRILDLGTGSGCVILSLLSELEAASGVGVDISFNALRTAKENAKRLQLLKRVNFVQSNWLKGLNGSFDIIISNPPYIPTDDINGLMPEVRCFDPMIALDGGHDGLNAYREIIHQINEKFHDNALIVFEIGVGQENDVKNLLMSYKTSNTFSNISYKYDLKGITRCIAAEIKNETCGC